MSLSSAASHHVSCEIFMILFCELIEKRVFVNVMSVTFAWELSEATFAVHHDRIESCITRLRRVIFFSPQPHREFRCPL